MPLTEDERFHILQLYLRDKGLVSHQISSYNKLINEDIPRIVSEEIPELTVTTRDDLKHTVTFTSAYIDRPSVIKERQVTYIYPNDARRMEMHYEGTLYVDITEQTEGSEPIIHRRVCIARIPVMLRSNLCNLSRLTESERIRAGECQNDPGGYFITKGKERALVPQIRQTYNKVLVFDKRDKKAPLVKTNRSKPTTRFDFTAEVRSMSDETGHSVLIKAKLGADMRTIVFTLPYTTNHIPAGIVFRAMGFSDNDIRAIIGIDEETYPDAEPLINSVIEGADGLEQEDCLVYIGQHAANTCPPERQSAYGMQIITIDLFPHMGVTSTMHERAIFLGQMLRKLFLTTIGKRQQDNKDHSSNKRIEVAGVLLSDLFRALFKRFAKSLLQNLQRRPDILAHLSGSISSITQGIRQCMSTGNWGVHKNSYIRVGVTQILSRLCHLAAISHLRRLNTPIGKEGNSGPIRQIHPSSQYYECPSETPEGQQVGLVKNLALTCEITTRFPVVLLKEILDRSDMITSFNDAPLENTISKSRLFLNGEPLGVVGDAGEFIAYIEKLRVTKRLSLDVSIAYFPIDDEIRMYCDEGRYTRPVLNLDNVDGMDNIRCWDDLLNKNMIRYVDVNEAEANVISYDLSRNYGEFLGEIHPSVIGGVALSIIPFPDHSQAPRNAYQSSMCKQAIGTAALSLHTRADTAMYSLHYPQTQLVKTRAADMIGYTDMPSGSNAIVAILCYEG